MKWYTKNTLLITQQKKWKRIKEFIWIRSLEFLMFSLIVVLSNRWLKDAIGMNLCKYSLFSEWKNLKKIWTFFSKNIKICQISNINMLKTIKNMEIRTFQSIETMFSKLRRKINLKKKTTKKIKIHFKRLTYPLTKIIWKNLRKGSQNMIIFTEEYGNKILLKENWESKLGRSSKMCILKISLKNKVNLRTIRFQELSSYF